MRLFVVDSNAPWVRSLLTAMDPSVQLVCLRVYQACQYHALARQSRTGSFAWHSTDDRTLERDVIVPGWTRFFRVSSAIVEHVVGGAAETVGPPDGILYTLPYYARLARRFRRLPSAYYAHDPFRFFGWDQLQIATLERELIEACGTVFAVAVALAEDLRRETRVPVYHLPNGVSSSFLRVADAVPDDLRLLPRPIVGCTGQINRSYDWDLIEALSRGLPETSFVFLGPVFEEPREIRRRIDQVLRRPNVHWLGPKPHDQLPSYLQHFDVCLNPLALGAHTDRRCPLRLFDYMTTNAPVVTTAVREAFEHQEQVAIARSSDDCLRLMGDALAGRIQVDARARRQYVLGQTWEQRARFLLDHIPGLVCREHPEERRGGAEVVAPRNTSC